MCLCVFSTLKYWGTKNSQHTTDESSAAGGATGRGRVGTMARGDAGVRARAGVHTGYIATAYLYIPLTAYRGARLLPHPTAPAHVPYALGRRARTAALATLAATEWTDLGSR